MSMIYKIKEHVFIFHVIQVKSMSKLISGDTDLNPIFHFYFFNMDTSLDI